MARPKMIRSGIVFAEFTVDPASIAQNDSNDVTVTVAGIKKGYPCIVWAPSLEDKVSISNAHCSTDGTLKFRLGNHNSAGAVDPASQTMYVVQF